MPKAFTSDGISFINENDRATIVKSIQQEYLPHIRAKGHFIIVRPYTRPEKVGSIILAETTREEDGHHSVAAQVIDIGPICYTDEKYCGGISWAQIGDWVMVPRVAGSRIALKRDMPDGKKEEHILRIVREDDIIAVINDPTAWEIRINATKF